MQQLFGREPEIALLNAVFTSRRAEFVALYGRRRVGKTYLIRQFFKGRETLYFEFTGQKDATLTVQLHDFKETLQTVFYAGNPIPSLDSWHSAFKTLATVLQVTLQARSVERAVIFLDELPWMAAPRSKLIQALDHVWNAELSKLPEVILVVCGSAASWMIDNLIHAKGGLHNRITRQIRLAPFSLPETIAFLEARQVKLGLEPAAELYMAIGGVPHYLNQVEKHRSVSQNIAALCFSENGILRTEFTRLFRALFGESDIYEKIVRALASKRRGLTRTELLTALKAGSGGSLNRKLKELEEAGFIAHMTPYDKARKDTTYRIIDPYVYFFLSWIERAPSGVFANSGEKYWLEKSRSPAYVAWAGYSFENLCLTHLPWIQRALRLDHIGYEAGSWNHVPLKGSATNLGAQIDLLFDRSDGVVSLCEIKFNTEVYTVTKTYARDLQRKLDIFQTITRTRKKVQWVLITCNGFKPNTWSEDLIDISLDAAQIFAGNA
jgi:uncharacterized protein